MKIKPPPKLLAKAVSQWKGPFLKVYLYRGFIGLPKVVREHARFLGLTRRYQTSYIPPIPQFSGNLLKIKELVKVDVVPQLPPPRVGPMYPKGYKVLSNRVNEAL